MDNGSWPEVGHDPSNPPAVPEIHPDFLCGSIFGMESAFRSEQDKDFHIGIVPGKLKEVAPKGS
jgi:hypothetical protein